jgi:thiazole synthase
MIKTMTLNGAPHRSAAATIADLVRELELVPEKVAVERNGEIVPRSTLEDAPLAEGDKLEIVHFVGGGDHQADTWTVAGRTFTSRLIVGTGKYKSFEQNAAAVAASGAGGDGWSDAAGLACGIPICADGFSAGSDRAFFGRAGY